VKNTNRIAEMAEVASQIVRPRRSAGEMKWLAVKIEGIVDDWLYAQKPLSGSEQGQPDWLAF
jgi:hypothetical protein